MRIVYIEDDNVNVFLVQRIARLGNHEVIHYIDGQSALANFERDTPDLMLVDIQLPGELDGLDVVRMLRAAGHRTPMVALTARAMLGDREVCLRAGCDDYIPKPASVGTLLDLFKRYDAEKRPAGEAEKPGS